MTLTITHSVVATDPQDPLLGATEWNDAHVVSGTIEPTQNNVAVDGVTITGDGTPGDPLVAVIPADAVTSVFGRTGAVVAQSGDYAVANITGLQTALDGKVDENAAITGATNTKITYDSKGLVTSGASATTADINDSSNRRYVTDAQLVVIGNTSGTNTGDQTSIVGITGTKAQYNTSLTDGDFLFVGDDTGITQLTGDVTAGPGSGSQAATLATVNTDVGSFTNASITVNGKGLITAASSGSASVTSVTGTADRITSSGGATPQIDIASTYVGQNSITTLGTITTGTWNGTDIAVADGGTGRSTGTTAYALIATGTTATGPQQTLAAGATTEILVGGGAAALPVWTTATGSGAPVRATSPVLVTPDLGTPSALVGTNITGTGASFTAGTATVANTVSTANEATDTTCFPLFVTASGTQSLQPKNNTGLTYNSNTNALSATSLGGTLTTAAQTNVTSVGTLTGGGTGSGFSIGTATTMSGCVRNSSDFVVSASTSLATVTGLQVALVAGGVYRWHAHLFTTENVSGGIKCTMNGINSLTATSVVFDGFVNGGGNTRATTLGGALINQLSVTAATIDIWGTIVVNAAGDLVVQFAQNTATSTSTVLANSTLHVWRLS